MGSNLNTLLDQQFSDNEILILEVKIVRQSDIETGYLKEQWVMI